MDDNYDCAVQPVAVLTVAGSDSGGGAGIEADLRTFAAMGVHGAAAVTAVTAQNTYEVRAVCALEAEMVRCQIETVTDDLTIVATKTGMLARPATVLEVAALARDGRLPNLVVDPVLVSSSGHALMERGGVEAYRDALLAFALVATPNLREAAVLVNGDVRELRTVEAMIDVSRRILAMGPRHVLVKGGHFAQDSATEQQAPDVLVTADSSVVLHAERIVTENDHGTGCSLAAALAARLALGDDVATAVRRAKSFVLRGLVGAASWHLGKGHGPIDHFGWNQ
jgi:hydroxymethylpyrimidine/phosphomethylpyrimidine kinase